MVLEVDPVKRRISLGLKQCVDNPWQSFLDKYIVGSEIEGEIKNITEFGLFVGLDGEIDGMVHLSDIDWAQSGDDAVKNYDKGQMVKVKVLDVDPEKERISLGIKQLSEDPFESTMAGIKRRETVTCTVAKVVENGLEVTVGGEVPGFIRRSDLSRERSEQRPDRYNVGDRLDARVTNVDRKDRKLTLSIKAQEAEEEKQAMADYGSSDSGASLGDILGAAISRANEEREAESEEPSSEDGGETSSEDEAEPSSDDEGETSSDDETETS